MAPVSTTYIRIVADFRSFRQEATIQARAAGENAARDFATRFRLTMAREVRGPITFNVQPVLDLTNFRNQYRLFRQVYLQDQSFLVNPELNDNMLRAAFLGLSRAGGQAGARAGAEAGSGFIRGFLLKMAAGAVAGVALQKVLAGLLPILGQLVAAAGAVGAALPAMILTTLSLVAVFKLALNGVGDAIKQAFAADDPEKLAEALNKLSPAARKFVMEVAKFRPQLKAFQQAIQQEFFTPMLGGFKTLMASPALNVLKQAFKDIAHDAGVAGRGVLDVVSASAKSGQLARIFAPITDTIANLMAIVPSLVQTFLTLADVGGQFGAILLNNVTYALNDFVELIKGAAADGSLAEFFRNGMQILGTFGRLLQDIGSIFMSVFRSITAGGGDVLGVVGALIDSFAQFLKTVEGQQALTAIGQVLNTIGGIVKAIILPLLPVVAKLVVALGGPLIRALQILTPAISLLVTSLSNALLPVIDALSPVIDVLVTMLAEFLADAITEVALHIQKMTPYVLALATQLGPHLIPIVEALGEVLMALVPLIPAISEGIVGLMPLVIDLIPGMIGIAESIATVIEWGAKLIVWIVSAIAWLFKLSAVVADVGQTVLKALQIMWAKVRDNVFNPLIEWIQVKVPHAFRYGVDVIGFWWDRLKGIAAVPVRFFVETVVNKGIIGTFNKVAGFLPGLDKLPELGMPPGLHGGGHVDGHLFRGLLPGEPSNVDNMLGSTPWGPIALAGGEFVVRAKEAKKPIAKQILNWINDGGLQGYADGGIVGAFMNPGGWVKDQIGNLLDKVPGGGAMAKMVVGAGRKIVDGLVNFVKSKLSFGDGNYGPGPGFPEWPKSPGASRGDSGVWRSIVALIRSTGPISGSFGNAYRDGDPLWHGSGRAVDWMGFNQDALASFFMNMRPRVLELIHRSNTRDYAVTRGVNKGSFNETLMNQHRNHIHIAMAKGGSVPRVMDAGGYMAPGWNPPAFNGTGRPEAVIPDGMAVALDDATIYKMAQAFMRAMSSGLASARQTARGYA